MEAREWAAIHNNPPPPQWKPAERPGFSRERELRSRRGHLAPLAQKSKDGKKKAAPGANKNAQPPYLDSPFDINDRGVAHIVTDQVRKLRPLLEEALQKRELPPVAVQTVCSGTDAPAIALGLASKDLKPELAFKVDHMMSCENEPFKQAYIAVSVSIFLSPPIAFDRLSLFTSLRGLP